MDVWQSVEVSNPDHPRFNQAGVVFGFDQDPDQVQVRFDLDLAVELLPRADLVLL